MGRNTTHKNHRRLAAVLLVLYLIWQPAFAAGNDETTTKIINRIAFGSCAADWVDQPIWQGIKRSNPDLYISTGDAIYADWDGEKLVTVTEQSLSDLWANLAARTGFKALRDEVLMLATWDNHDYGSHNLGADFPLRKQSESIFLDFWQTPASSPKRTRDGVYGSHAYGPPGQASTNHSVRYAQF